MAVEPDLLLDGLVFPEGARWHEGRLWFSDMHAAEVVAVDEGGRRETIARVPGRPSGLGWLPDGDLLVVSMEDRKVLRRRGDVLALHADLQALAPFHCNDMVVDGLGRAYVGNFGFDLFGGAEPAGTDLIQVDESGNTRAVASDLLFPNGMAITPDGTTLIVAETWGGRLTAFTIGDDGGLTNRVLWADLRLPPDGIAMDAEGCVWVAVPTSPGAFLRVAQDGEVRQRIDVPDASAYACALGGGDGRTLFLLEARTSNPSLIEGRGNGRIRALRVRIPHAGLP